MKILTLFWAKPIPTTRFDWSAIDDDTYDGPPSPVGYGSTEQEAIEDLLDQLLPNDFPDINTTTTTKERVEMENPERYGND